MAIRYHKCRAENPETLKKGACSGHMCKDVDAGLPEVEDAGKRLREQ